MTARNLLFFHKRFSLNRVQKLMFPSINEKENMHTCDLSKQYMCHCKLQTRRIDCIVY